MTCLDELSEALLAVTPAVYHFHAHKPPRKYVVWAEDGAGDTVFANGHLQNQAVTGTVDFYTDDPENLDLFTGLQAALNSVCAWRLNSVQYEDDTGLTHYEWVWEMAGWPG